MEMCGRYTLASQLSFLEERFEFEAGELAHSPQYNIAPTQEVLVVTNDRDRQGEFMRWGLIPSWAKDASMGNRMVNARAETVGERPSFRVALRKRRCLVLADGFYEWRRQVNRRIPMRIVLKSREPFAFAGLWEQWKAPSGQFIRSCTIITTTANALMEPIHDRMPVILPKEAESIWLDSSIEDPGVLATLLGPYPAEEMDAYPVSTLVNSPRNSGPDCIEPQSLA